MAWENARFAAMTTSDRIEWIAHLCISAAVDCSPSKYIGQDDTDTLRDLVADARLYIVDFLWEHSAGMRGASREQLNAGSTWRDRIIDAIFCHVGVRPL